MTKCLHYCVFTCSGQGWCSTIRLGIGQVRRTLKVQDSNSGEPRVLGGVACGARLKCVWTLTSRLVSLLGCTRIDHSFFLWIFGGTLIHKHGKSNRFAWWTYEWLNPNTSTEQQYWPTSRYKSYVRLAHWLQIADFRWIILLIAY